VQAALSSNASVGPILASDDRLGLDKSEALVKAPRGIVAIDAEMQLTNTAPVQSNQRLRDELCSSYVVTGASAVSESL